MTRHETVNAMFARLNQRLDEGGSTMSGPRCPSVRDDATTPSGRTRCALDIGHTGDHIHANTIRTLEWTDEPASIPKPWNP